MSHVLLRIRTACCYRKEIQLMGIANVAGVYDNGTYLKCRFVLLLIKLYVTKCCRKTINNCSQGLARVKFGKHVVAFTLE
jgi:hypothetical protein